MNSVKSGSYFENYSHRIRDMGHIESDNPNSAYMVGSAGLELSESNEVGVKYGFILGLK